MSGHNKWSTIKHKKGAADAKRGKMFSRLGKEITLAAREGGGDPDMNARLRTAINSARVVNMPNDNIERAIKKGTGELEGHSYEELSYEGYAAGGVAMIVNCLSDNRNRTAAEIRALFTRHNGNFANTGAVSWMFHSKARFVIEGEHADEEKLLELLLDSGADVEDIQVQDGIAEVVAAPDAFGDVVAALEQANIPISESSISQVPDTVVAVEDEATVRSVLKFIEVLEDHDDVQEVFSNIDIPDEMMDALTEDE